MGALDKTICGEMCAFQISFGFARAAFETLANWICDREIRITTASVLKSAVSYSISYQDKGVLNLSVSEPASHCSVFRFREHCAQS